MASTPEEPSQTWRDNEDMEGTGEGYYASRLARGTELLDILAEHHVGFRPTLMVVNKDQTASMLELVYADHEARAPGRDRLSFTPKLQEAVNQPISDAQEGRHRRASRSARTRPTGGLRQLKFYAIKVVISSTFTTYLANAFLTFYNDAYAHFYQTHMDATTQANAMTPGSLSSAAQGRGAGPRAAPRSRGRGSGQARGGALREAGACLGAWASVVL